ncbi:MULTISPECIES: Grx4 family monothiol glutaredoxin [Methylocaldum]|jgi:monothiol glutaredoxin|uniref:Grx4 family monothiol glutaredoxin n=1 Tax=unclassified Methylocaldum TaxID=2622260 RepID=UPI00098BB4FB|nr:MULTISPECIES: Grx4 family monothiol glutaredoxin [unclassified Methylocaldum]MBP1149340.1 monothiol glutaredoxin [Methylocaldum sp. RMAD-M]MDV3242389.1 Grx4 family monothiol glutaredoxin [Methylocaldum sp.]MVF21330.1 Grx4 family monothiol glutaredoxin [Methylocaldum sp. BRCS4]
MDVTERIKKQLAENPVILYMKGSPDFPQCGFSGRAVQILERCGVEYAYVNIFEDPELREGLKVFSQWPTFPQLYINGELVGGSDIMLELFESGELQKRLSEAAPTSVDSSE